MSVDLDTIRRRLATSTGRRFWRTLEEAAETPEFMELLRDEFPRQAAVADGIDRRQFLRLMGASLALAGVGACTRQPPESIVPYAKAPEEGIVPGVPLYFATAMPFADGALGLLVESHMGRPTKVEGNPDHPMSLGATDVYAQASVLQLYDPDRAQVITSAGEIRPWSAFLETLRAALAAQRTSGGAGLRLLTERVTSPTLARQIRELLAAFPGARWIEYEPLAGNDAPALDVDVDAQHRVDAADVILALDADFLACGPTSVRDARAFSVRRRPETGATMNRLYVVEPMPTVTGAKADHRLALRASDVERLALAIAAALRIPHAVAPGGLEAHGAWIAAVARDLAAHRGASLVIAGDAQPPAVHALARAMNQALGNVGRTVVYTEPFTVVARTPRPVDAGGGYRPQTTSLSQLADDMDAGRVGFLLVLDANPVVTAPADLRFAERLAKVPLRIRVGLYDDETSRLCHWHVPAAHYLESWSDVRAHDGTVTIIQPLIAPLYDGKTAHELLDACVAPDGAPRPPYEIVREHWKREHPGDDFETFWRRALHDGVVPGTAGSARTITPSRTGVPPPTSGTASGELEITFRPDPTIYDGRFANNGWLQELPKPMTRLTWDNAACLAPATAERLHVANGDVVELRLGERAVHAPVWVVPGHAADAVTVHLGYGRTRGGRVAQGAGFDAYALRTTDAPWIAAGLTVRATGATHLLASTQGHWTTEGRDLVRIATAAEYRADPGMLRGGREETPEPSLYRPYPYEGYAWAMAIDLSACTGCNACVVACQAENNIPVVGKDQVTRGREMHWIRVDRYFEGSLDAPAIYHQPVPCMHCENAPCEVVCPVNATVHNGDGLNQMIYNRCVGTRYCSNNCPYKVRRFNFYLYSDWRTEPLKLQRNPDVTVRSRGVMEKCTYCVQRIQGAKIDAEKNDRRVRDGEVVPACAQACPAEAIVFGDLNDASSRVAALRKNPRTYALLAELNTRPRTTYLAALRNPNPEIEA